MERSVYIGKYTIKNTPADHWAFKVDNTWYELLGTTVKQTGTLNKVNIHYDDTKYKIIKEIPNKTTVTDEKIQIQINKWIRNHPIYAVHQDNCQLFVKDMIKFIANYDITTQNNIWGNIAIVSGLGSIIVGSIVAVTGILIKNH